MAVVGPLISIFGSWIFQSLKDFTYCAGKECSAPPGNPTILILVVAPLKPLAVVEIRNNIEIVVAVIAEVLDDLILFCGLRVRY